MFIWVDLSYSSVLKSIILAVYVNYGLLYDDNFYFMINITPYYFPLQKIQHFEKTQINMKSIRQKNL